MLYSRKRPVLFFAEIILLATFGKHPYPGFFLVGVLESSPEKLTNSTVTVMSVLSTRNSALVYYGGPLFTNRATDEREEPGR